MEAKSKSLMSGKVEFGTNPIKVREGTLIFMIIKIDADHNNHDYHDNLRSYLKCCLLSFMLQDDLLIFLSSSYVFCFRVIG